VATSLTERPKRLTSLVYRKTTAIERLVDHLQTARGGGLFDIRGFITREVLRDDDNDTSHEKEEEKGRRQNKNKRSGFDMVDIANGTVLSLARRVSRGRHNNMMKKYGGVGTMPPYRTGRFAVDIDAIHRIAVPAIRSVMMADDDNDDSDDDDVDSADVEVAATAAKGSNRQQNDKDDTTTKTNKVLVLDEIGHMELHSIQFRNAVQQLFHVHHRRHLLSSSSSSSSSDNNNLRVIGSIPKPGAIPWCDELCRHHESFLRIYDLNRVDRDATVADVIREIDEEWIFDPTATTTPS
jgi:nucleoside-triphosphatase THEP1